AIPFIRSDYVQTVVRQRWVGRRESQPAVFADDPNGNVWNITRLDRRTATDAWWQTLTDVRAWGGHPAPATPAPFGSQLAAIPGRVEAEAFDDGGPGVGYIVRDRVYFFSNTRIAPIFRVLEHVQLEETRDAGDGLNVIGLAPGDWTSYSVNV